MSLLYTDQIILKENTKNNENADKCQLLGFCEFKKLCLIYINRKNLCIFAT